MVIDVAVAATDINAFAFHRRRFWLQLHADAHSKALAEQLSHLEQNTRWLLVCIRRKLLEEL